MIDDQSAFIDEEHEVVAASPVVNQVFPISLWPWFPPCFPPLALIDLEKRSHLDIVLNRVGVSQAPDNDLLRTRRTAQLSA